MDTRRAHLPEGTEVEVQGLVMEMFQSLNGMAGRVLGVDSNHPDRYVVDLSVGKTPLLGKNLLVCDEQECDRCGSSGILRVSDYAAGAYASGWACDNCYNFGDGMRWHCRSCQTDRCFACTPRPGQLPTATSSSSSEPRQSATQHTHATPPEEIVSPGASSVRTEPLPEREDVPALRGVAAATSSSSLPYGTDGSPDGKSLARQEQVAEAAISSSSSSGSGGGSPPKQVSIEAVPAVVEGPRRLSGTVSVRGSTDVAELRAHNAELSKMLAEARAQLEARSSIDTRHDYYRRKAGEMAVEIRQLKKTIASFPEPGAVDNTQAQLAAAGYRSNATPPMRASQLHRDPRDDHTQGESPRAARTASPGVGSAGGSAAGGGSGGEREAVLQKRITFLENRIRALQRENSAMRAGPGEAPPGPAQPKKKKEREAVRTVRIAVATLNSLERLHRELEEKLKEVKGDAMALELFRKAENRIGARMYSSRLEMVSSLVKCLGREVAAGVRESLAGSPAPRARTGSRGRDRSWLRTHSGGSAAGPAASPSPSNRTPRSQAGSSGGFAAPTSSSRIRTTSANRSQSPDIAGRHQIQPSPRQHPNIPRGAHMPHKEVKAAGAAYGASATPRRNNSPGSVLRKPFQLY